LYQTVAGAGLCVGTDDRTQVISEPAAVEANTGALETMSPVASVAATTRVILELVNIVVLLFENKLAALAGHR
jgi:hypothetical protein